MKRAIIQETGGPEGFEIEDVEPEPPGAGELRIKNNAIGLNFIDIYQRKGLYPMAMPAVLGSEGAGAVEAVGEGVEGFAAGDRIAYIAMSGGYAELTNVSAAFAAQIPADVSDEIAASVFLKGLTAEMLLRQVFRLEAGQTALVYAAAGGVGSLLCPWAKHIGGRVIGVVGGAQKVEIVKQNGADEVIDRKAVDNIPSAVRGLTGGRGVDVVYDSIGAATFEASLDCLAMRGMMVSYGNASGPAPAIAPLELTRRGSLTLARPSLFHYATPDRLPGMAEALFALIAGKVLKPKPPQRFPLEKVADAHRLLESGKSTGAIVLRV